MPTSPHPENPNRSVLLGCYIINARSILPSTDHPAALSIERPPPPSTPDTWEFSGSTSGFENNASLPISRIVRPQSGGDLSSSSPCLLIPILQDSQHPCQPSISRLLSCPLSPSVLAHTRRSPGYLTRRSREIPRPGVGQVRDQRRIRYSSEPSSPCATTGFDLRHEAGVRASCTLASNAHETCIRRRHNARYPRERRIPAAQFFMLPRVARGRRRLPGPFLFPMLCRSVASISMTIFLLLTRSRSG